MNGEGRLDIVYCGGPGDVIGTYRRWRSGASDPSEVSETYSGQFFTAMQRRGWRALVIATCAPAARAGDGVIDIEHRPKHCDGRSGLAWIAQDLRHWFGVVALLLRRRPRFALVADLEHWWVLALPALCGTRIVLDLQCALWPRGHRRRTAYRRLVDALNGWFWRRFPVATLCISPECARQVVTIAAGAPRGALLQTRSSYHAEFFRAVRPPVHGAGPFALLFAGRLEQSKGIFDLLEIVEHLGTTLPQGVQLTVCGEGPDGARLAEQVRARGLGASVRLAGRQDRDGMREAYSAAHAVVVPTTSAFAEGMTRVVIEGVLAGRPVVATTVCNAGEALPGAVIEVAPGDIDAMVAALARLALDTRHYARVRACCEQAGAVFYDRSHSWGAALERALDLAERAP